jgi:putative membrane protein
MNEAKRAAKATGLFQKDMHSIEASASVLDEESDFRTALAADRTLLAAERTYAAWVRTGLAALASGIGARALLKDALPMILVRVTATVLILFAGFCMCAAVWREFYSLPSGKTRLGMMPRYVIIPVNGFLILVTLAALVGVWIK